MLTIAALFATAADQRFSIYTPHTSYSVTLVNRDGHPYVPLLDVLAPLGSAAARQDGDKWKLKFNDTESEFKSGKTRAKVNRKNLDLSAPFVFDNGRALVPLQSLVVVLARLLPESMEEREPGHRLFIGGATTEFKTEFQSAGPKLVLRFSAPVNPSISTEPGRLRMVFTREPVIAAPGTLAFDDKTIRSASFSEHDGIAELTIHSGAPLLATFGDQNRTITIAPVPQVRAQAPLPAATPPPAPAPAPTPEPASPSTPQGHAPATHARTPVVIDPGHGGDDRGAALSGSLAEKDVTLAWARRLRAALEQKGIAATLLREGDASLSFDQRAALTNAARPLMFITLHAGTTGAGVRIYTAHLGETAPRAGSFLPWDAAQASFLDSSRALAGSVAAEMTKRSIPVGTAPVLLRPLNNVAASAVAIEVMPLAGNVASLMDATYQQSICAAIADGIAGVSKPAPQPGAGAAR
ncbi:MAG: N-acetylmuramoyl-L-alanine amidase [Acidobacteriia bacterium]|nr:N-acetylmuramoyl-L-alanine amidase [Terriglobia bacterium]